MIKKNSLYWLMLMSLFVGLFAVDNPKEKIRWEIVDAGINTSLRGIGMSSEQNIWVTGNEGTVLNSLDGGKTWLSKSPDKKGKLDFRDVEAINESLIFVMSAGVGKATKIFCSRDGGNHWKISLQNSYAKGFLDSMAFWNKKDGIVMGDPVSDIFYVAITRDGGLSWKELKNLPKVKKNEAAFAASGRCIHVQSGGRAWFITGGSVARVFYTSDYGQNWHVMKTEITTATASSGIYAVNFWNPKSGIITGGDYQNRGGKYPNMALSHDGGTTWDLIKNAPVGLRSAVTVLINGQIVVVGKTASDISTNKGKAWNSISHGDGFYAVASFGNTVWAAGAKGKVGQLKGLEK